MSPDELYEQAMTQFGSAIERLSRSYEADAERRRDLLQEIHLETWRSFHRFAGQCSLRTWVYRVAHNVAVSHVMRDRRARSRTFVSLDEVAAMAEADDREEVMDRQKVLDRLYALIAKLTPLDRQTILLYIEGMDAASIGEITGISPGNAATKVHRIKNILATRFREGGRDGK